MVASPAVSPASRVCEAATESSPQASSLFHGEAGIHYAALTICLRLQLPHTFTRVTPTVTPEGISTGATSIPQLVVHLLNIQVVPEHRGHYLRYKPEDFYGVKSGASGFLVEVCASLPTP